MLATIIIATSIIGLVSISGILVIFNTKNRESYLKSLISLAAGSLLAVVFLDLLPETIEGSNFEPHLIFKIVLGSMIFFFLFERVLHWHHCQCEAHGRPCGEVKKNLVYFNLLGDGMHNIVDGFLVAAAFMLDFHTGLIVTLAVIMHEIPQEISDFGVLLYAGLKKSKALLYNFMTALTAVLGAIIFYFFSSQFEYMIPLMTAFAAGNFIYLATADLIPELHHEKDPKKIVKHSIWLIIGIAFIYLAQIIIPHGH
jgi:zinc and cadmium transporter